MGDYKKLQEDPGFQERLRLGQEILDRAVAQRPIPDTATIDPALPPDPPPVTEVLPPAKHAKKWSSLPAPFKPLSGSWIPSKPKPSQALTDFPPYFPSSLKPLTTVIIIEATEEFPAQSETRQLCKKVISRLTPHLIGTERADLILSRMGDLLHYLLVANCDNSDERSQHEKEIKKSEEWKKMAAAVAAVIIPMPLQVAPNSSAPGPEEPKHKAETVPHTAIQTQTADPNRRQELLKAKIASSPSGQITNADAAAYYGCTAKTIRNWISKGKLQRAGKRGFVTNSSIIQCDKRLKVESQGC